MNINSPLLRKFLTLGRIDADTVKAKQQDFAQTTQHLFYRLDNLQQ